MSPASPVVIPETTYAIGIDIGGTKVNAARIRLEPMDSTLQGESERPDFEFENIQRVSTPEDTKTFIDTLVDLIHQLKETEGLKISCVGISTAGIVDPNRGMILGSTGNLPAIQKHPFDIRTPIQERTGLPVYVENDANAAAYGEFKVGAGKVYNHVFMATLGTGVGTGLIVNSKLVHGGHFSAGEGGHICIDFNSDRQCSCGKMGCWEAYASGPSLAETARRMVAMNPNTPEAIDLVGDEAIDTISTHQIILAWKAGNVLAKDVLDLWHRHIAAGLGGLINLLDPDVSVIGGGMAQFVDFKLLKRYLGDRVINCPIDKLQVIPATLGNQAGMIGAAYLATEHILPTL